MKIIIDYPPNIEQIDKVFNVKNTKGIVYAYGDVLYNPDNGVIDVPLIAHEQTHTIQQGDSPEEWWVKYLNDSEFRLSQEIEAYRNQYIKYCDLVKDKNKRFNFLRKIASDLSSPMYGNIIKLEEALKVLK
jgi:hypothetical protein